MSLCGIDPSPVQDHGAFGAIPLGDGTVRFRFWAPALKRVDLLIEGREPVRMSRIDNGWFETITPCETGAAYRYKVNENLEVADPAARAMRGDAFGHSLVYDPDAYSWRNDEWKGRPWRALPSSGRPTAPLSPRSPPRHWRPPGESRSSGRPCSACRRIL